MKVWPKDDNIRKLIKHPIAGSFREEGPSEWPDDTFTARRLRDGDVTLNEPAAAPKQSQPDQQPAPKKKAE